MLGLLGLPGFLEGLLGLLGGSCWVCWVGAAWFAGCARFPRRSAGFAGWELLGLLGLLGFLEGLLGLLRPQLLGLLGLLGFLELLLGLLSLSSCVCWFCQVSSNVCWVCSPSAPVFAGLARFLQAFSRTSWVAALQNQRPRGILANLANPATSTERTQQNLDETQQT